MPSDPSSPASTLGTLRRALLLLLIAGMVGTAAELLLLAHTEDVWQLAPLGLFAVAGGVLAWLAVAPSRLGVRALQGVMVLFVASGGLGVYLHSWGNREFALETEPALGGWKLFAEMMTGAFPALAPGTMVLLGLIGLLFTWRHPSLA